MSPVRTVVHIGSDKTGSTALQHALASSRTELLNLGVFYPDLDGRPDHRALASSDRPSLDIAQEAETIIVSSEALWPLPAKEIADVLRVLPAGGREVLAYVREPGDYAEAAFLQRCRMSTSERQLRAALALLTLPPAVNPIARRAVRRFAQLSRWSEAVEGPAVDRLLLRPYLPGRWAGRDIVGDFCEATDLPETKPVLQNRPNPVQNPTPDLGVIHAAVLIRSSAGPQTQARFLDLCNDGTIGGDRKADGPYTGSALRDHVRRAVMPRLIELDERHGGLAPMLTTVGEGAPSAQEAVTPRLDREAANELRRQFDELTGDGPGR